MKIQNTEQEEENKRNSLNSILSVKQIRVKIRNKETNKESIISYLGKDSRAEEDIEDFKRCSHLEIIWVKEKRISFYDNVLRKQKQKLSYYKKLSIKELYKENNEEIKKKLYNKRRELETYINYIQNKRKEFKK